jgi:hypothetical protein
MGYFDGLVGGLENTVTGPLTALYDTYNNSKNNTAGKYRKDLQAASDANTTRLNALSDYYQKQQAQAVGYYAPLRQMYQNYYGTQGVQAPQLPPRTAGPPMPGTVR